MLNSYGADYLHNSLVAHHKVTSAHVTYRMIIHDIVTVSGQTTATVSIIIIIASLQSHIAS